jgi:hypothetical protein
VLIDIADGRLAVADTACRIVVREGRPIGCCTLSGLAARTSDFSEGWGQVPFWAKDIKVGFANSNAEAGSRACRLSRCVPAAPLRRGRA